MTEFLPIEKSMAYFLPIETSKNLVAIGAKSESGYYWCDDRSLGSREPDWKIYNEADDNCISPKIPAFFPWDFISTSEQARENARILWPGADHQYCDACWRHHDVMSDCDMGCGNNITNSQFHRHACIDSPDAVKYIVEAVEGKK